MTNPTKIATQLNIRPQQVTAVVELLDAENTIPFIARYRKEATGGLDEEQLRAVRDLLDKLRALDARRETVLKTITEQGKLTEELKAAILSAETRTALEDIYQPYKPKRKTRASAAREKGLQPLADLILQQPVEQFSKSLDELAQAYLNADVPTLEDAWAGARDIVAETISDNPDVRRLTRKKAAQWGIQQSEKIKKAEDPRGVYQNYYEFEYRLDRLRPHQILALNRGEKEKVLRVKLDITERDWRYAVNNSFPPDHRSPLAPQMELAAEDAAGRLLLPAIERDLRRSLTEEAETHAINVFATNLRALLSQPPLSGHVVMGIDPGFRTGCKVAVVDPTGEPLDTATIYPHPPQKQRDRTLEILSELITRHDVTLITIGNGTASRETEQLIADLITNFPTTNLPIPNLHYLIVSEAGASVYSASPLARAELPGMDVSMRGAVSIARRVQDPLAELVKIDPQAIGVGMYQHDVDQKEMACALDTVVESVVNQVGVDVNTASPALLAHVSGIGPKLAARIVAHRDTHGPFPHRKSLQDVAGLGPKAFQQAAGFLRIRDGKNPLDASAIHPESYPVAEAVLARAGLEVGSLPQERESALNSLRSRISSEELANELGTGIPTLEDIFEQLIRPGRDPRADLPAPILRSDVLKMEDLAAGMRLRGTVRNVVDFGTFVDIGVKQDGLLHRSQIPRGARLSIGDVLDVEISKVEAERGRISLGWLAPKQ
ncbi:MAG: Tex family protein [Chloroflexota bacterium]